MRYLNEENINEVGIDWGETISVIEGAVSCLGKKDFSQPVKPYLRYKEMKNRIIAMPAFVGGDFDMAGIKWIASFPDNIQKNIPRAHSVVILNKADTGKPVAIINTALLSIIRTVSVSGALMKSYDRARNLNKFKLGIIGWGPIGQHHLKMCMQMFGDGITDVYLYDLRPVIDKKNIGYEGRVQIHVVNSWEEVYDSSDVFITCTVSKVPYIDKNPKKGMLLLNVSLRDYTTDIFDAVKDQIIVDDWEEVCRENTDIENMHKEKGLMEEHTRSIIDAVCEDCIKEYEPDSTVMFNPMGMAVFDIAMGAHYYYKAVKMDIGKELE